MHKPYQSKIGHPADFRVEYIFNLSPNGPRTRTPRQGYKSDFWYFHEDQPNPKSIYMIHPEFEDENQVIITDTEVEITQTGTASMWIVVPKMREFHRSKISVGLTGYFMEGPNRVAECKVIEILGLLTNPIE